MPNPDLVQSALRFAAEAHRRQTVPGTDLPYILHLAGVAAEVMVALAREPSSHFDSDLAIACAFLHDTLEDTPVSYTQLEARFGSAIADGVQALTKNPTLPGKEARMRDSLERIRQQGPEIALVKLADRIVNLQPPPAHWSLEKRQLYREEAIVILDALRGVEPYLENRLEEKIEAYRQFIETVNS